MPEGGSRCPGGSPGRPQGAHKTCPRQQTDHSPQTSKNHVGTLLNHHILNPFAPLCKHSACGSSRDTCLSLGRLRCACMGVQCTRTQRTCMWWKDDSNDQSCEMAGRAVFEQVEGLEGLLKVLTQAALPQRTSAPATRSSERNSNGFSGMSAPQCLCALWLMTTGFSSVLDF